MRAILWRMCEDGECRVGERGIFIGVEGRAFVLVVLCSAVPDCLCSSGLPDARGNSAQFWESRVRERPPGSGGPLVRSGRKGEHRDHLSNCIRI